MLFLASEADPLNVATEALIAWSVDCKLLLKVAYPVVDVISTLASPKLRVPNPSVKRDWFAVPSVVG